MGNNASHASDSFFQQQLPPPPGVGTPGVLSQGHSASIAQEPSRPEAQLVPTVLQWLHGGGSVHVTGSFNSWGERIPLQRSGGDFVVCLNLLPGTYQYKFIVDNEWRYATEQQTVRDQMGNINNCVTVEDQTIYLHEDPCSGFFENNPSNVYTQTLPDEIALAKEPPVLPVHLTVLPLNMVPLLESRIAATALQPPLSVTLQHVCLSHTRSGITLSTTHRFRSKFITTIIHKPSTPTPHPGQHPLVQPHAALPPPPSQPPQPPQQPSPPRVSSVWWSDNPMGRPPSQQMMDAPGAHAPGAHAPGAHGGGASASHHHHYAAHLPPPSALPPPGALPHGAPGAPPPPPGPLPPGHALPPQYSATDVQAMDLGSRPGSSAVLMDTSAVGNMGAEELQQQQQQQQQHGAALFGGATPVFGVH